MSEIHARRGAPTAAQYPGVTVFLQRFPGVHGPEDARGIAGVPFTVRIPGQPDVSGTSGADGAMAIPLPPSATSCTLNVFGVDYNIRLEGTGGLGTPFDPNDDAATTRTGMFGGSDPMSQGDIFRTFAISFARLGYHALGDAAAGYPPLLSPELDHALRDFQMNEAIPPYPDGNITEALLEVMDRRLDT
jgi:hypothetical protein